MPRDAMLPLLRAELLKQKAKYEKVLATCSAEQLAVLHKDVPSPEVRQDIRDTEEEIEFQKLAQEVRELFIQVLKRTLEGRGEL